MDVWRSVLGCLSFQSFVAASQVGDATFWQQMDSSNFCYAQDVQVIPGGYGYIGTTLATPTPGLNSVLVGTMDMQGNALWTTALSGASYDDGYALLYCGPDCLLTGSSTYSFGPSNTGGNVLLNFLNLNGRVMQSAVLDGATSNLRMAAVSDGYIMVANRYSVKINQTLGVVWSYDLSGGYMFGMQPVHDGEAYIVTGTTSLSTNGNGFVAKVFAANGSTAWQTVVSSDNKITFNNIEIIEDVVATVGQDGNDTLLTTLNVSDGQHLRTVTLGGDGENNGLVIRSTDVGFAIAMQTTGFGTQGQDPDSAMPLGYASISGDNVVLGIDSALSMVQWAKRFGHDNAKDQPLAMQPDATGFVMAGIGQSSAVNPWGVSLAQVNHTGGIPGCSSVVDIKSQVIVGAFEGNVGPYQGLSFTRGNHQCQPLSSSLQDVDAKSSMVSNGACIREEQISTEPLMTTTLASSSASNAFSTAPTTQLITSTTVVSPTDATPSIFSTGALPMSTSSSDRNANQSTGGGTLSIGWLVGSLAAVVVVIVSVVLVWRFNIAKKRRFNTALNPYGNARKASTMVHDSPQPSDTVSGSNASMHSGHRAESGTRIEI